MAFDTYTVPFRLRHLPDIADVVRFIMTQSLTGFICKQQLQTACHCLRESIIPAGWNNSTSTAAVTSLSSLVSSGIAVPTSGHPRPRTKSGRFAGDMNNAPRQDERCANVSA
jgi:hypothetical protein